MKKPRVWPAWVLRWLLNLFPPFLLGGIRVSDVPADCSACRVRVRRALLTRNLNGTTFGGTLYSACDPLYAVLYWQALARRGLRVVVWTKRCSIAFARPARGSVWAECALSAEQLDSVAAELESAGRAVRTHSMELSNRAGEACVRVETEVYVGLERA